MYHYVGDKDESMDRGCRDISGVIGPRLEGPEVSNDAPDRRQQVTAALVALPQAFYISVQMLEILSQNCHFCHFSTRPARLAGGKPRSATRCSIMRSDMTCARPGSSKTERVWVHRNCHTNFRRLFTISDGSQWHLSGATLRYGPAPDSSASSRMSVRRPHCCPPMLLFEPCDADVRPRDGTSGQQTESVGMGRQTTRPPGAALDSPLEFC
jgi:hypothetical protein